MTAPTTLITGANRGLGLEFARQCVARGDRVIAGCRHPDEADELQAIASDSLEIVAIDVASDASIADTAAAVDGPVSLLVNNAGIYGGDDQSIAEVDSQIAADVYRTNVIGPMMLMQALAPKLASDARVLNVSSGYASIASAAADWPIMYCCSKAALNMLAAIVGRDWSETDRVVVAMSPGWVRTDMGGDAADLSPEQSVRGMLAAIDELHPSDTGRFLDWQGEAKPY